MASLFEEDHDVENRIDQESPKPDFYKIFLSHYNNQELNDLWHFLKDSDFGPHIFLKGLFWEYAVYPLISIDKKAAFQAYQKGAEEKDSYCNFRLHFIYKKEFEEFGVQKDRTLEMLHIIKAAAFFDEKDNRINRKLFDPVMHLAVHLDNEDPDLIKSVELLEKYKEKSESDKKTGNFLHNWCCVRFSLSDHTKDECLKNLHLLAEEKDGEACYFLGEAYRYGEEFRQDLELSKKYLETAKVNGCIKAIESLGYLYQLNKQPDLSLQNYNEGAKVGSYTSLKIFGEYQIVGKYTNQNFEKGLKNIYYAYLQCDFWALLTMYEIYKYFELKEKRNLDIQSKMFHLAQTLFSIKGKIGKIAHIRLAYSVYSECFEKGYGTNQDLNKARAILLESLEKIELEKLKTLIYYRLAIISERRNEFDEANKYYDSCIRACLIMVEGYNIIKNQAYYYLLGKLLYLGRGTTKNIEKAVTYLREGIKMENSFYFGAIYSKKCQNLLKKIPIHKNILKTKEIQVEENDQKSKILKGNTIFNLKDVSYDMFLYTLGPIKAFQGRFKGQLLKLEEYYYTCEKNYIMILNHLIYLMNIKSEFLDKIIGIAMDHKTCLIVSVFKPIDSNFISLEDYFGIERFTEKTTANLKSDHRFSCQRSQYSEENNYTERVICLLSTQKKSEICLKVAKAIQSLHFAKIPHGNLTPNSIYVSQNHEIVVSKYGYQNPKFYDEKTTFDKNEDFGIGEALKYLSPESLQKNKIIGLKSDIWSLGCIIYLIFCQKTLLNSVNIIDILQAQKKKIHFDFRFNNETPKAIQDIIQQCIKINPKDRCDISFVINTLHNYC